MLNFILNDKIYEFQSNNQLSIILSQFDSNYVIDIMEDTIESRLNNFDLMPLPNMVQSFEDNFKLLYDAYPSEFSNIQQSREQAYKQIIEVICRHFNLHIEEQMYLDYYTLAYYLYDFFVARFNNYMITFFDKFIDQEKYQLYQQFNLDKARNNRDIASSYSKMVFHDDDYIGLIIANLPDVLLGLRNIHVPDEYIFQCIYPDQEETVEMLTSNVIPMTTLFNTFNSILFNEYLYPTIITHIRMAIQMSHATSIKPENAIA